MSENDWRETRRRKALEAHFEEDMELLWPSAKPSGGARSQWLKAIEAAIEADPALELSWTEEDEARLSASVLDSIRDWEAPGAPPRPGKRGRTSVLSAASLAAVVGSVAWAGADRWADRPFDSSQELRAALEDLRRK